MEGIRWSKLDIRWKSAKEDTYMKCCKRGSCHSFGGGEGGVVQVKKKKSYVFVGALRKSTIIVLCL